MNNFTIWKDITCGKHIKFKWTINIFQYWLVAAAKTKASHF